jgi:hypothetical protein
LTLKEDGWVRGKEESLGWIRKVLRMFFDNVRQRLGLMT